MKFKKIVVTFDAQNISLAEELICNIFFSFNIKGVVCDVPLEEPDEGFGTHTLPVPEIFSVTGFLPLLDSSDIILKKMVEKMRSLEDLDITVDINTEVVDEEDWSDAWKKYFEVTRITDRITIKPEWKDHVAKKNEIIIHIDPGMAFGTGTHPTTAMCIQMIEKYLAPDTTFLDIGTGSGILMITAAKLGAKKVFGIDTDELAINIARKNLSKNEIYSDASNLICTDLDKTDLKPYDFIAVNIIAQVIVDILPQVCDRMTKDTITILSGIIKERQKDVMKALKANNLFVIHESYVHEWVCLAIKRLTKNTGV